MPNQKSSFTGRRMQLAFHCSMATIVDFSAWRSFATLSVPERLTPWSHTSRPRSSRSFGPSTCSGRGNLFGSGFSGGT